MLNFLADNMNSFIWLLGFFELVLFITLYHTLRSRSTDLRDSLKNLLRGVQSVPTIDNKRHFWDEIAALTSSILYILKGNHSEDKALILHNLESEEVRRIDVKTQGLENRANTASALVQVFSLLGIFGTILGLSQSMALGDNTVLHAASMMNAFGNAITTTLSGLFLAVTFMLVEARWQGPYRRFNEQVRLYKKILEAHAMRFSRSSRDKSDEEGRS